VKNIALGPRTVADIDAQVAKVIRGLQGCEPPLDLRFVRDLLKLDRSYYRSADDGLLRETINRLKIAGKQVLLRPTILGDVIRTLSLKALYLPDQKRILIDEQLPPIKHRWNEAHEIGHDIIPWHAEMMLGDTEQTLRPSCQAQIEAEANYAAGQILFLAERFVLEGNDSAIGLPTIQKLSKTFGNTLTSTLWRFVEKTHPEMPMVALVTAHPHFSRRPINFDPQDPCRYCIQSPAFRERFGDLTEVALFQSIVGYCGPQRGGSLGAAEILLPDHNGQSHVFRFETFFNSHEALTLGVWAHVQGTTVPVI
jgi:hypothetical protein